MSACVVRRGGENTSAMRYFLLNGLLPRLTWAFSDLSCFLVMPPALRLVEELGYRGLAIDIKHWPQSSGLGS